MDYFWTVTRQTFHERVFGDFYGKYIRIKVGCELPVSDDEEESVFFTHDFTSLLSPYESENFERKEIEGAPTLFVRALRFLFGVRE
jgi:hypothetical protein